MIEKIGAVRNPLTIIAIFAGIAEVSGTIVLPFVNESNQRLFIYFLIVFPSILIIAFFLTLNMNNKALYAPSDYKDEERYIKLFKYDVSKQENVVVTASNEVAIEQILEQMNSLSDDMMVKFKDIDIELKLLKKGDENPILIAEESKNEYEYMVLDSLPKSKYFVSAMRKRGYNFQVYKGVLDNSPSTNIKENKAIWLGDDIPLGLAKELIRESKIFYPHLEYISISYDGIGQKQSIFIGGATDTAIKIDGCLPMSNVDFQRIEGFTTLSDLHAYIETFKAK